MQQTLHHASRVLEYLLNLPVREGDGEEEARRKRVMMSAFIFVGCVSVLQLLQSIEASEITFELVTLGVSIIGGLLLCLRQWELDRFWLLVLGGLVAVLDAHSASHMRMRAWPALVVLANASYFAQMDKKFIVFFTTLIVLWFLAITIEESTRSGAYDALRTRKPLRADCSNPPCREPIYSAAADLIMQILVLLATLIMSRWFLKTFLIHKIQLEAVKVCLEVTSDHLAQYDIHAAAKALTDQAFAENIPDEVLSTMHTMLNNLAVFRAFLPSGLYQDGGRRQTMLPMEVLPGSGDELATLVHAELEPMRQGWERMYGCMIQSMQLYDTIMREACDVFSGHLAKVMGDAVTTAFFRSTDALNFSLSVHEVLNTSPWPADLAKLDECRSVPPHWNGLRVSVGIFKGEVTISLAKVYKGPGVDGAISAQRVCVPGAVAVEVSIMPDAENHKVLATRQVNAKSGRQPFTVFIIVPEKLEGRSKDIVQRYATFDDEMPYTIHPAVVHAPLYVGKQTLINRPITGLSKRVNCTVGKLWVDFGSEVGDIDNMQGVINDTISKVIESITFHDGAVTSLTGTILTFGWNTNKRCSFSFEKAYRSLTRLHKYFTSLRSVSTSRVHVGLSTGDVFTGCLGTSGCKFLTSLGKPCLITEALLTSAIDSGAFCLYCSFLPIEPRQMTRLSFHTSWPSKDGINTIYHIEIIERAQSCQSDLFESLSRGSLSTRSIDGSPRSVELSSRSPLPRSPRIRYSKDLSLTALEPGFRK